MLRIINSVNKNIRNIRNIRYKTGADIVYESLLKHNVTDTFIYSGGSIMPLIDKFYQGPINYYINTHEQNGGHAATGYAKSSDKTGVIITTSGPGATNLITPMLDAQNDSTPLVVITGQVGLENMGTDAFQEAPSCDITKSFTKASICVNDVTDLDKIMDYAFLLANDGKKGVVHIDLPKCISTKEIIENNNENKVIDLEIEKLKEKKYLVSESDLLQIAEVINNSKKPILVLGQGALRYERLLSNFINKNSIPFTTTIHAKGIINDNNELSLSWLGMHGHAGANYAVQEADCIIAIGSRFDDRTTGNTKLYAPEAMEKKQIIHIDIEKKQFNKSINSHYNVNCDVGYFLDNITPMIKNNIRKDWTNKIKFLKKKYKFQYRIPENNKLNTPLSILSINNYLNNTDKKVRITTGVGNHQMMTYQFIDGDYSKKIFSSGSLGVMGAGLPYAIGVQIANPEDLVIDIDGDSSFMMTCSDMKTIMEYNLPVKIAIMNDSRQMMVNIWERLFFEERYTATINNNNPSFTKLAESFGLKSFKVDNINNLQNTTNEFLSHNGPALCEYIVGPEICLPLVGPGKALDDMIMFDEYHYGNKKMLFDKKSVPS
jgi:acetolactate synthase I/II/III large subunit